MTRQDEIEFSGYLKNCTDKQVLGVWDKEFNAGRNDYAALAAIEASRRGIDNARPERSLTR